MTQRATLVAVVGSCFYIITLLNSLPQYFSGLTWLALSILISSAGLALLSLQGLDFTWNVAASSASEALDSGDEMAVGPALDVTLYNGGTLSKTGLVVEIRLRPWHSELATRSARNPWRRWRERRREPVLIRRFLIEVLPTGRALSSTLTLTDLPRGRYQIVGVRLIASDVLGLFRFTKRLRISPHVDSERVETILTIGPASVGAGRGGGAAGAVGSDGELAASDRFGRGEEMRGTRPYVPGDDLRTVHWKSTARTGKLIVKEFHPGARASAIVVWDGAAVARRGKNLHAESTQAVEESLRLAMSLCRALFERGQPATLLRLDAHPVLVDTNLRPSVEYSPQGGFGQDGPAATLAMVPAGAFRARCSAVLAEAAANRRAPLIQAISSHLHHLTGRMVFLVTPQPTPQFVEAVHLLQSRGLKLAVAIVACDHSRNKVVLDASRELAEMGVFAIHFECKETMTGSVSPKKNRWKNEKASEESSSALPRARKLSEAVLWMLDGIFQRVNQRAAVSYGVEAEDESKPFAAVSQVRL